MFSRVVLVSIILFIGSFLRAQSTLNPGEIAIIAMNSDGTDDFSFVLLAPVTSGTVIHFAESGWLSAGGFRGGGSGSEGTVTWTASSALTCGTEVAITSTGTVASTGTTSVSGAWALSTSGDQILAYQGTSASPTFIYAINNEGAGVWQADATSANTSAIPTGLTNGINAVAVNEADNVRYDCSTTTPPAGILAAVSNNSNWLSDNTTPYSVPLNCGFSCAACIPSAEPTTNSFALTFPDTTCSTMDLSWTAGNGANRIVVASLSPVAGSPVDQTGYIANSSFGFGSTIAAGEFVVYNGSSTSFTVFGLSALTTYYFAIFEYNGATANCEENYFLTSVLTGSFTTPACPVSFCPELKGILVDACGGAIEGINEFFTFQNGNTTLYLDSLQANFPSGGSFCNSGCGAQNWTTNPAYVAQLNTTAACPGLFVEADPIPANAEVIVFTGASPTYNFDFTGLCGTGTYYAVFANNASTTGRFANYNATCSLRTLDVDFGNNCSDTVSYDRCLLSNVDGDYVTFDAAGNPTYQNDGCTPTAVLPIDLLSFTGKSIENGNLIEWITESEINNDYFSLEKSSDAINFISIGTVIGAGNSNSPISYSFIDDNVESQINYYRLKQTDYNGQYSYSNIISLSNSLEADIYYNRNSNELVIKGDYQEFSLYDLQGRIIINGASQNKTHLNLNKGVYIVKISTGKNLQSKKIVVH